MLVLDMKRLWNRQQWVDHHVFSVALLVMVLVASLFPAGQASAISNVGLDPTEFANNARYALEESRDVTGANNTSISVYYMHNGTPGTAPAIPPTDMVIRVFDISPRIAPANNGVIINGNPAVTRAVGERNVTIPRTSFSYRTDINAWVATITARMSVVVQQQPNRVQFRLQVVTPSGSQNAKIGYSSTNSNNGFASANTYRCDFRGDRGCGLYYNYRIPFGAPCSLNSPVNTAIVIEDGDNTTSVSQTSIQYQRQFTVQIINTTTNTVVNNNSYTGGTGNRQTARYPFTVVPDNKYEFRVNNVYTNNVLQFKLPYDSIESIANCNWDLRPSVTLSNNQLEANTTGLRVTSSVSNNGPAATPNVDWQVSRCVFAPGTPAANYGAVADNTLNGVQTYRTRGGNCAESASGERTFPNTNPTLVDTRPNESIGNDPPGTRVCYILSLNPPSRTASPATWRHSTPACVIVVKKPKLHVIGGDVLVGRGGNADIVTSSSTKTIGGTTRTFGSWGEYALVASGDIFSMASGAGYSGGATNATSCAVSLLTFANAVGGTSCTPATGKGQYDVGGGFPAIGARLVATASLGNNPTVNLANVGTGSYAATGTVQLSSTTPIPPGKWVVINAPNATVQINSNIQYTTNPLQTIADIPQVVIIANRINIAGGVGQVDSWLIASGTNGVVSTCSDVAVATQLRSNNCNNRLTVNGPVLARQLLLYRTAGSDAGAGSGNPAEVFNFRPDAYLWATSYQGGAGRIQSVYTKELPPRF